jgi:hypothetical protein
MAYNTQNAGYGFNFTETDFLGGPYCGALSPVSISGGGKKRKQMRTKKKRGSSKRKNRRVSTLRKKRGSSKRKNRGSFKRRKHSKRDVVQSIMKGLGEKRKSRKKSMKGGIGEGWLADRGKEAKKWEKQAQKEKKQAQKEAQKAQKQAQKAEKQGQKVGQKVGQSYNPFRREQYKPEPSTLSSYSPGASNFEEKSTEMSERRVGDPYSFVTSMNIGS